MFQEFVKKIDNLISQEENIRSEKNKIIKEMTILVKEKIIKSIQNTSWKHFLTSKSETFFSQHYLIGFLDQEIINFIRYLPTEIELETGVYVNLRNYNTSLTNCISFDKGVDVKDFVKRHNLKIDCSESLDTIDKIKKLIDEITDEQQ